MKAVLIIFYRVEATSGWDNSYFPSADKFNGGYLSAWFGAEKGGPRLWLN